MIDFTNIHKQIFKDIHRTQSEGQSFSFFDKVVLVAMGNGCVARFELSGQDKQRDEGLPAYFTGYLLRIVNKKEGELERKFFCFNDYLTERTDNDTHYSEGFTIAPARGEFHIAHPSEKELEKFGKRMIHYVQFFD